MTVDIDLAGITNLLNEAESLAVLTAAASSIEANAATMTIRGHSGHRRHIADRYATQQAKPTSAGGEAAVTNSSSFFHLYQFGSIHQPPARVIERAIRQAGYIPEQVTR